MRIFQHRVTAWLIDRLQNIDSNWRKRTDVTYVPQWRGAPVWEARYIAGPHGVGFARGLMDLQALIGGGAKSAARHVRLRLVA